MAQLTWQTISPLDTSKYLDAIQKANAQSLAGVEQIGNAYKGYYDNLKKQNTNDMLTALNQAQTPEELAAAQANIAAMQQRWGTGYDMDAVRTAVDERPTVLNQRASQALKYQQEKALHEALPQINAAAAEVAAGRKGVTPEMAQQLDALAALGIDASGYIKGLSDIANSDFVTERAYNTAEEQRKQTQKNWQADYDFKVDESNWGRADTITKDHPKENTLTYQDGKWVTVSNPGISRMDAYGALSGVRGIRNNNPGNIEFNNQPGASLESKGGRFARFSTPEQGLNAMSKQLDLYFTGKSRNVTKPINTIQDIISTWAPPKNKKGQVENNTAAYIASVSKAMGVSPTAKLNLNDPNTKAALMAAMITHENGGNPYTHEQYIAGITGKTGTAAAASNAIQIPQSVGATAVSNYSTAITELNNKFNLQTSQDQTKTGMDSKGQTIDSWLISKSTKDREGSTLVTDYSRKVAKLARNNAKLSNLPMEDQLRVLDAAHAWALTPGGVITDKYLDKRITELATSLIDGKKNEHEQAKKNIFETQYQAFVKELNALGMGAISRDAFRLLVSPETAPKPSKQKPNASTASQASQSSKPAAKTGFVDNPFPSDPAPKPAPQAASQAFIPFANLGVTTPKPVTSMVPNAIRTSAKPTPQAATPRASTAKAETKAAKPTKQDVVAYYVRRGEVSNVVPDGINPRTDRQLIREAQAEARKQLAAKKAKEKANSEANKAKQRAEAARVSKEYAAIRKAAQKPKTSSQAKTVDMDQLRRAFTQQQSLSISNAARKAKEEEERKRK